LQPTNSSRNPNVSISEALAAVRAESAVVSPVRFPGEDGGRSLAEMAQRDLDAALQLLADRAQFITGASGAAIALRRRGRNDMLCRASAGSNAPELGALLSTEFGLSGESVRTRQLLRCDDAERDARVNHDVCRQLGIASVVVMPVANDEEVLGVFELFSGRANAFGERDLSAVQRLSEMVETAVRLARAAESFPEQLKTAETPRTAVANTDAEEQVSLQQISPEQIVPEQIVEEQILEDEILELAADRDQYAVLEDEQPVLKVDTEPAAETAAAAKIGAASLAPVLEVATLPEKVTPAISSAQPAGVTAPAAEAQRTEAQPNEAPAPKTKLLWSAAVSVSGDAASSIETDQSHVPPVLRGLRKCEACGFPISATRVLCVECEEKKWRGQLKVSQPANGRTPAKAVSAVTVPLAPKSEGLALAAAAHSVAASPMVAPRSSAPQPCSKDARVSSGLTMAATEDQKEHKEEDAILSVQTAATADRVIEERAHQPETGAAELPSPGVVFSAGMEPSQSWIATNKYIIGALLVAAALTIVFLMR
jgi:hypothetical protein